VGTASSSAVVLAAQLHATDGTRRGDEGAVRLLKVAAQAFGSGHPGALAGAASATADGAVVLDMAIGAAVMDAMLALAAALRPHRPTFCGCIVRRTTATGAPRAAAAERAVARLADTDVRGPRALVLVPDEDAVLGALLDLILDSHDRMTDRQRQVVALVRDSGSQQAVARHLNVSRQAVNQSLAAAGWPRLSRAESVARARLARAAGENPEDQAA
jgi:DNA-binding phage protein